MKDDTYLFAKNIHDLALRNVPAEKARAVLKQAEIARALAFEGGHQVEGLGQHVGRIDMRTFMRHWQENVGCWNDSGYIKEFFKHNKCYKSQGYRI